MQESVCTSAQPVRVRRFLLKSLIIQTYYIMELNPTNNQTRICKSCGEELPLTQFRITKGGVRMQTCNDCIQSKRSGSWAASVVECPYFDPDFDGKDPGEVVRMMGRAKRWLESRGYSITLKGEYKQIKVITIKFQ